jgi:hypothetical protein
MKHFAQSEKVLFISTSSFRCFSFVDLGDERTAKFMQDLMAVDKMSCFWLPAHK